MIFYVSIGNSDDMLTQGRWSMFVHDMDVVLEEAGHIHGAWFSRPDSAYQNACWCVEVVQPVVAKLQKTLTIFAQKYGQDSITWAEAPVTRFLGQPEDE